MPRIFNDRVYFDVREAALQMCVSLGTMARWAREGEHQLNNEIEVHREGKKRYISQSSLKRVLGSERRWAEATSTDHPLAEVSSRHLPTFESCFISYSTVDQEFADRLFADLQAKGVRCWFAPHHMVPGKKLHEQIEAAIRVHDRLLLILSSASMTSEWVRSEIAKARRREVNERRRILFPLRLVPFESLRDWKSFDTDGNDSAGEIREYFIPDFSRWRELDSYRTSFDTLLHALNLPQSSTAY